jgi:hypothetical protein
MTWLNPFGIWRNKMNIRRQMAFYLLEAPGSRLAITITAAHIG